MQVADLTWKKIEQKKSIIKLSVFHGNEEERTNFCKLKKYHDEENSKKKKLVEFSWSQLPPIF